MSVMAIFSQLPAIKSPPFRDTSLAEEPKANAATKAEDANNELQPILTGAIQRGLLDPVESHESGHVGGYQFQR